MICVLECFGIVCMFTLKKLKENILEVNLRNVQINMVELFYIYFFPCLSLYFYNVFILLSGVLLKACITKLWTPTVSQPGCEYEFHLSVTLRNLLKFSITCFLIGKLWIITIPSHWVVMRLSNLKYIKAFRAILDNTMNTTQVLNSFRIHLINFVKRCRHNNSHTTLFIHIQHLSK